MRGNCGNISSAVSPYVLDKGLVPCQELYTPVRFLNTNAQKVTVAHVPSRNCRFEPEGEYAIPGVPGMGSKIVLDFLDPGGPSQGNCSQQVRSGICSTCQGSGISRSRSWMQPIPW